MAGYDFAVSAPTLNSSYLTTMSGVVHTLPQYAFDLITNNLPMFLFFVFLSCGIGLYSWFRRSLVGQYGFSAHGRALRDAELSRRVMENDRDYAIMHQHDAHYASHRR